MENNVDDKIKACREEVEEKMSIAHSGQNDRMDELHECIKRVRDKIDTIETNQLRQANDVSELLSIFRAGKGAIRVFGWFGVLVRWLVAVGIAIAAIIAFIKSGIKP